MKRLKELRTAAGLSQQTVASKLGITQQAYANYERGKRQPDNNTLLFLADLFNVSVDYLLGKDIDVPTSTDILSHIATPAQTMLPIIGTIRAGYPVRAEEHIEGWELSTVKNPKDYFFLRVAGDSMIGAGITDGLGCGDNTKAMLMTRGLTETARLGVALGAQKETFTGLSGVGDLIVTCTSMHSRNRRAGILIGQGKDAQTAMKEVGAVVEGYYAAKSAYELGKVKGIDMPITEAAYQVLYEGAEVKSTFLGLMSRNRKTESENPGWL